MSNFNLSANMNLPIPVTGEDPGPDWANNLNASLTLIDLHDHSAGNGVPVTPAGLNISSDLSFISNNATNLRTVRFTPPSVQPALGTDLDCLYAFGVDLYYNDGSGNKIRITQSGGIAGTPGSISGLSAPASASYNSFTQTFIWQSGANIPANMDGGSFIFRNITVGSNGVTVSAPAALASNYTLTLPTLPASQKIMTLDGSGNISAPYSVDNSTIVTTANIIQVPVHGITGPSGGGQIALATVDRTNQVAVGQQISSSSGSFQTSSATYVQITNFSFSLTTTGRPVVIGMQIDTSGGTSAGIQLSAGTQANINIKRGSTILTQSYYTASSNGGSNYYQPTAFMYLDTPGAGTYTYTMNALVVGGSGIVFVLNLNMIAYEL